MKTFLFSILALLIINFHGIGAQDQRVNKPKESLTAPDHAFMQWLFEYIPSEYPNAKLTDHTHWLQAHIGDDIVVNWAQINEKGADLKYLEGHHLTQGKIIFIERDVMLDWINHPAVTYFDGAGYYVSGYDSVTMRSWNIEKFTVIQFDGDAKRFTEIMARAWVSYSKRAINPEAETEFANWLKKYVPSDYPGSKYDPHNCWYQVFIADDDLTISWGLVPQERLVLNHLEALTENKSIFIAKENKEEWADNSKIYYFPNVGYYIPEFESSTMGNIDVGQVTVIQFDGEPKNFVDKMVKAYGENPNKSELEYLIWLKEFVRTAYPTLTIDYHGGWYQSILPQGDLTVTWGTMATSQMVLKELHGLHEGKSLFIERNTSGGWEILPDVDYIEGVGYYISKYDTSSMGDFEVGYRCVVQFDGNGKEFTEKMVREWVSTSY